MYQVNFLGFDKNIIFYFQKLGYKVDWDFSSAEQKAWYELYDNNGLAAQFDVGIELDAIIQDLISIHEGKPSTSVTPFVYEIRGMGKIFNDLCKKVYDHSKNEKLQAAKQSCIEEIRGTELTCKICGSKIMIPEHRRDFYDEIREFKDLHSHVIHDKENEYGSKPSK